MSISTKDLIALFQQALDEQWGYIYGASGQVWTQAKQNKATRTQTKKYGQQWVGRRVSDCSGLFYWAFKELGGSCYHGSNAIFKKYTSANGTLIHGVPSDGSALKPGTAVFKYNTSEGYHHIGLYTIPSKIRFAHAPFLVCVFFYSWYILGCIQMRCTKTQLEVQGVLSEVQAISFQVHRKQRLQTRISSASRISSTLD